MGQRHGVDSLRQPGRSGRSLPKTDQPLPSERLHSRNRNCLVAVAPVIADLLACPHTVDARGLKLILSIINIKNSSIVLK